MAYGCGQTMADYSIRLVISDFLLCQVISLCAIPSTQSSVEADATQWPVNDTQSPANDNPVFCASAPNEHNFVSGLAVIVSNDVVAEHVLSVSLELFHLIIVHVTACHQDCQLVCFMIWPRSTSSQL